MCKDKNVAEIMNNYFIDITKTLNLNHQKIVTVMASWN